MAKLVPALLNWFTSHARDLPWRRTCDPYAIWVSEIMLQQTQVKTVIPYWERWLRELPTIQSAANASPDKIHKLWEGLGYYSRARNLQKAAKQIVENCRKRGNESQTEAKSEPPHVGCYKFPENYEEVLALPGIGRYTAGAICSIAFNQPAPILDGNVIRVLTRVFGIAENPKEKKTNALLWKLAEELVRNSKLKIKNPKFGCSHLNQSLMELGALICTPRNPQCGICPVKKLCLAFRETRVEELPNLGKRTTATARRFAAFVVEQNGRFLVRQRPAGVVNAHLWEFPNVEIFNGYIHPKLAAKEVLKLVPSRIVPLCVVKHSITRYRITLEAFHTSFGGTSSSSPPSQHPNSRTRIICPFEIGTWKTRTQLDQLAFSSAHRKILEQLPFGSK